MHWHNTTSNLLKPVAEQPRAGLITDMDGTISHIVDQPDQAQITARSRELLKALHPCLALVAIVSGRAAEDIRHRVGLPELVYVGNHGLERWIDDAVSLTPEAAPFRPRLEAATASLNARKIPGMVVEDKGATLSVHYRQVSDPNETAIQFHPIIQEIADSQGLRLFQGRMVFELRPPIEVDKGTAFRNLVEEFQLDAAIYIGDDTTDVDALHAARQLRESGVCHAVGIGVQSPDMPEVVGEAADVMTSGVSDVEALFSWLLKSRKASSTC